MNLFRRWHAHHEFRHHFGHGRHGHGFGHHADGFAYLLVARLGAKLGLDAEQQRRLAIWLEQLQRQRDALKQFARGPEVADLMAGEQFAREPAQRLIDARLDSLREAGPGVIAAFADFFDSLGAQQRELLRSMTLRRRGCGQN
ncbi:hypothetical protein [Roseateles asaccharophilus]|uniref:Periplasmic heavy metal sensor n=1 Tax=Roseateles asaccharophilus TaxID=582607 RepID=A0ABU2AA11_9BURK|nr:hypothetical protein [Roseateles asaccharophilus]MDR7334031.1 hypothetical protein [Roseateles asaccharophilus]